MKIIKSPLRYPGGKSRALKKILQCVPKYEEYREPFVGGGSVFFTLKQLYPDKKYWINDKNKDLYLFWMFCKNDPISLVRKIRLFKKKYTNGRILYNHLMKNDPKFNNLERAARFFILNRISFSGLVDCGGYSDQAYKKRFTDSSINRIYAASKLLQNVKITNKDYSLVLHQPGQNVFIFLDPPYLSKSYSRLYGKKGDLHFSFDHARFFKELKKCSHKWLVTYDNCSQINLLFNKEKTKVWRKLDSYLRYGTNNRINKKKAKMGKEFFIMNYKI